MYMFLFLKKKDQLPITVALFKHSLQGCNSVTMWDNAVTTIITEIPVEGHIACNGC